LPVPPDRSPFAGDDVTHYQLLGIPFTATTTEVTSAYRQAMKRVHPDRARPDRRAEAEEYAKRLNLAHATLSKPEARRAYDETIKVRAVQDQIMNRYAGGVAGPGMEMHGAFGRELRRELTRAEQREQALAGRSATASVLVAFVGLAAVIVALLIAYAVIEWAVGSVF
jgi:curved DNA-binding protein CbpA